MMFKRKLPDPVLRCPGETSGFKLRQRAELLKLILETGCIPCHPKPPYSATAGSSLLLRMLQMLQDLLEQPPEVTFLKRSGNPRRKDSISQSASLLQPVHI